MMDVVRQAGMIADVKLPGAADRRLHMTRIVRRWLAGVFRAKRSRRRVSQRLSGTVLADSAIGDRIFGKVDGRDVHRDRREIIREIPVKQAVFTLSLTFPAEQTGAFAQELYW